MGRAPSRWIVFAGVALAFAVAQFQQFETTLDSLQIDPDNPPPMRATLVDEHGKTIEVDAHAEPSNDASTMELGEDGTLSPRQQAIQMRWQKMLFDYLIENAKCAPELLGLRKLSKEEYEAKALSGRVISEACDSELDRLASEFQGKVQRGEIQQPPLPLEDSQSGSGDHGTFSGSSSSTSGGHCSSSGSAATGGKQKKGKAAKAKAKAKAVEIEPIAPHLEL